MRIAIWAALIVVAFATRLAHHAVLWVEEAYPMAAAMAIQRGAVLYGGIWFDKPPLFPLLYLLEGAQDGWWLRIWGALFVLFCAWITAELAARFWGRVEEAVAAVLSVVFLTFGFPATVMALTPDILVWPLQAGAVWAALSGRNAAAGAVAGLALWMNPKVVFLLPVCWMVARQSGTEVPRGLKPTPHFVGTSTISFLAVHAVGLGALAVTGSLQGYLEQVWRWGALYSADPLPLAEGLRRLLGWTGFHAGLIVGLIWFSLREQSRRALLLWTALALITVCFGLRFFPRYFFVALPALILCASRGAALAPRPVHAVMAVLLLVPVARFGPGYIKMWMEGGQQVSDLALFRDARPAVRLIRNNSGPNDRLLVWGYRPEIYVLSGRPPGTQFLDSQPLTGVLADRHLVTSKASAPELAARQRSRLQRHKPEWIVDGLGPLNPALGIDRYPDMAEWFAGYSLVASTPATRVYRLTSKTSKSRP